MRVLERARREYALALKKERSAARRHSFCAGMSGKRKRLLLDLAMRAAADSRTALTKLEEVERQGHGGENGDQCS